jgi:hypothetical protein
LICRAQSPGPLPWGRRRQIHARRLEQRDRCAAALVELADAIEAIDDLVRLIVQQCTMPALDPQFEHDLDRRLAELDEIERAHGQLDALAS